MITAENAKKVATDFNNDVEGKAKATAEDYAEKVLAPIIEERAKEGAFKANFEIDCNVDFKYLKEYLETNGFKINKWLHTYDVMW